MPGMVARVLQCPASMLPGWMCVVLLYTAASLHSATGQAKCNKRSRSLWYRARSEHEGFGLSDAELQTLSRMSDMKHFKNVLNPILIPRVVGTESHTRVRKHLVDTMRSLGWTVEEDHFQSATPLGNKQFANVIATLNPDAPRRLVLACHYDSKIDREGVFVGATDSAVPCAMMLNLAKVMQAALDKNSQTQSDLTLQFIFFDGEEAFHRWSKTDSLYGARNLAEKLENSLYPAKNRDGTNHLQRMDLFVLLDLLGTEGIQIYNYFKNTERWFTRLVSYEQRLKDLQLLHEVPLIFKKRSMYNSNIEDDHIPFLRRDVPVLHLIPVPFPSVWHKNTDNEGALHYPSIENFNKVLRAFVADYLHVVL